MLGPLHHNSTVLQGTEHVHQTVQIHFTLIQICKICWQSNSVPIEKRTVTGSCNFLLNITDYIQFLEQHYQTRPFIFTKCSHLIGGGKCKMSDEAPLVSPRPVQSFFSQYKWRKNIKMFLTIPLILDDSFLGCNYDAESLVCQVLNHMIYWLSSGQVMAMIHVLNCFQKFN